MSGTQHQHVYQHLNIIYFTAGINSWLAKKLKLPSTSPSVDDADVVVLVVVVVAKLNYFLQVSSRKSIHKTFITPPSESR